MSNSNRQRALNWIYQNKMATRSDLVNALGISQASIMRLVADLLDNHYLIEKEPVDTSSGRGRPSEVFGISPNCGVVAGIEFGRENLLLYYTTADGTQIDWCEVQTIPPYMPIPETLDELIHITLREAQQFNIQPDQIRAIGLSVHDLVTADGEWVTWGQPLEHPFAAQAYISQQYGYLGHVDDVSRTFAFAEHRFGAGRGVTDLIYLFVGKQGIGSGIFVNGLLLKSASGFCGEVGHIEVEREGLLCQCGNRGCLETVATYEAVLSQIRTRLQAGVVSSLNLSEHLSIAEVCQAYQEGDKEARIVLSRLASNISKALVSTINIVGATRILIGGQLHLAGEGFATELASLLQKQLIPGLANRVSVSFAELAEYAGAWGVATQALDKAWESGHFLKEQD